MPEPAKILIVDDDSKMLTVLEKVLTKNGYIVTTATNGNRALARLQETFFDIILTDVRMPGLDGMDILKEVKALNPEITVIMMTAFGSIDSAVEAMKQGAYDYISKPFKMDEVLIVLNRVVEEKRLRRELASMKLEVEKRYRFGNLIGKGRKMQEVFNLIERVAPTRATILITGASGTGKELVAKAIHYNSPRKDAPFIPINCGAIPEDLLESELFGHVKGAFTGAMFDKKGLFEEADTGTLFLDEIGELGANLQVKLLRALQDREIRRVGGIKQIPVDVRIIAATNQDLQERLKDGRFREDLFYRLNVVSIHLPPLAERPEDIPLLADHFVKRYAAEMGKMITGLSDEVMAGLVHYPWSGNVRELENAIERAVILNRTGQLTLDDLPELLQTPGDVVVEHALREDVPLDDLERRYILEILKKTGGHQSRAAEILGIDRRTLYRKLRQYGVDVDTR